MPAPERWLVLSAGMPSEDPLRGLLAEALLELGGSSILEEPGQLTTYLTPPPRLEPFLDAAQTLLRERIGQQVPVEWRWQADEDWNREWRRGLQPRKVSPRLVVRPSWTTWDAAAGESVIEIDPQMAFGTGEHATTRGCLRLLDRHFGGRGRGLDIGSGSAVLAIAAAMLGADEVIAVEYDPDANLNARDNVASNGVADRVRILEAMADDDLLATLGHFEIVLANILSGVIRPLLPAMTAALTPEGRLITSGILVQESADVVEDARRAGLMLLEEDQEEEWWSGVFALADETRAAESTTHKRPN
jgi:ribosomal protein L11 methyltransferase